MTSIRVTAQLRAGKDAQEVTFPAGGSVVQVSACHNQGYYDKSNTWVEQGEVWIQVKGRTDAQKKQLMQVKKGDLIVVSGSLRQRTYTTKDGGTGVSLEIAAQEIGITPKTQRPQSDDPWAPAEPEF